MAELSELKFSFLIFVNLRKKGQTKEEDDEIIHWLTGYSQKALDQRIHQRIDFATFFKEALQLHVDVLKITRVISGYHVE